MHKTIFQIIGLKQKVKKKNKRYEYQEKTIDNENIVILGVRDIQCQCGDVWCQEGQDEKFDI